MNNNLIPAEMRQAIQVFFRKAEAIVNSFASTLDKQPPPSIFTDIFNLNDPTELRHGLNPALEILAAEAADGRPEAKIFSKNLGVMLRGGIEQVAHFFVCVALARPKMTLGNGEPMRITVAAIP